MSAAVTAEKDLQSMIVEAARWGGWMTYHTFDSRRSAAGFPDLILVRGPELLAWELKSQKGALTDPQKRWLSAFDAVSSVSAAVVRPDTQTDDAAPVRCLDSDEAAARLLRRRGAGR